MKKQTILKCLAIVRFGQYCDPTTFLASSEQKIDLEKTLISLSLNVESSLAGDNSASHLCPIIITKGVANETFAIYFGCFVNELFFRRFVATAFIYQFFFRFVWGISKKCQCVEFGEGAGESFIVVKRLYKNSWQLRKLIGSVQWKLSEVNYLP